MRYLRFWRNVNMLRSFDTQTFERISGLQEHYLQTCCPRDWAASLTAPDYSTNKKGKKNSNMHSH